MAKMRHPLVVVALALAPVAVGLAQTAKPRAFEVASVRLTAPGARGPSVVSPARVDLVNYSLRNMLLMAFSVDVMQLSGQSWLTDVRVDIHATPPPGTTRDQIPEMLLNLMVERFGLVTHIETRPFQVHELIVGPDGMKMREVEAVNELAKEFTPGPLPASDITSETIDGRVRSMAITLGQRTVTDRTMYERVYTARQTTELNAVRMTMPELVRVLASNLDEMVVDRTGLTGVYQFKVELSADASSIKRLMSAGITSTVQGTPLTEPTGVSTVKAVEGLGLKLERRRLPLPVVVVDVIQRTPTEN